MNKFGKCVFFLLLPSMFFPAQFYSFDTVQDLVSYAKRVEEFPDSDLDKKGVLAQVNPTFHEFYPTIDPGFLGRILCRFNIFKPLWCFSDFISATQRFHEQEEDRPWRIQHKSLGSQLESANIVGCTATDGVNFIIVGELSGAFHSLARIIEHWYQNKIIDQHFRLIDEKKYIIFLGNMVGTSAYNLETLTTIETILKRNPQNIWYICGNQEERQRWHENPLYHAIAVRSRLKRADLRGVYQLVDDVFSLLPKAFIITSQSQKDVIICTSDKIFDEINMHEVYDCVKKFTSKEITGCSLYGKPETTTEIINLVALFETRRTWTTASIQPPVEKRELISTKAAVWDLVSGATRALLSSYLFKWNGYFILTPRGEHLEQSTLEYIGRQVDIEDTFKSREMYHIVTGELVASKTPLPK